jgi:hypothetical protein
MMLPARDVPEEDPSRTGLEGAAEAMDADRAAEADVDADVVVVTADADVVAYDPAAAPASPANADADAAGAGPSVDAVAGKQWSDVLAMFVDDPRGSVAEASVMANEAIEAFIAAARDRQASLSVSWQGPDADTERLRVALQDYRAFWGSVTQLRKSA